MAESRTGRGSEQFVVRLPDGMRDRIKIAASINQRSMNAEIVATLEETYPPVSDPHLAEMHQLLSRYLNDQVNFTDEDEYRLNTLIVEYRMKQTTSTPSSDHDKE
ncbi:Arc family DNA-binding protein [Roseobacter sp. HKCCD9010]|uniref:Arc family DNA-binding protein n=1 Tax=unclassified Roseobacter TaxID=196798 RepID=UPI001491414E|nr:MULTISPECIES: Arc family DNA-binding protein [unclassified Roseobacter]MBF9050630.1 Arc family DNA-binding protein [Rhodobacterales bacterium HKCCD4356]NNV11952.1 Arc family DNA-binding protein [Roseobacter sp. HKCCD7357]NNV16965.1 Arc family DNA-binding protein [Roseobacter sp. HKCCD8768]NNV26194.1 Arc family DNA-binding protein [Roseobacter sp. HKCCD8192]NNV30689.1 Arc family DNA-binding protein [Roseobacter sp. HKCCD9061]